MADATLVYNSKVKAYDLAVASGDLLTGDDLKNAVLISLFSWARADEGETDASSPRYGWWGDLFADTPLGSKLYLLRRAKITPETLMRAREYILDALSWMVRDGVAADVSADVSRSSFDLLRVDAVVTITRPDNATESVRFTDLWSFIAQ